MNTDSKNLKENAGGTKSPLFHIVLVHPEIPGNTGSIGRTALALGARLHLIHPLGFDLSEKSVRRAGLDYWKYVDIHEYPNFEYFLETNPEMELIFFSGRATKSYLKAPYSKNCALIFGCESKGLGESFTDQYSDKLYKLPIRSEHIRSLNLASIVTAASYECLRQLEN